MLSCLLNAAECSRWWCCKCDFSNSGLSLLVALHGDGNEPFELCDTKELVGRFVLFLVTIVMIASTYLSESMLFHCNSMNWIPKWPWFGVDERIWKFGPIWSSPPFYFKIFYYSRERILEVFTCVSRNVSSERKVCYVFVPHCESSLGVIIFILNLLDTIITAWVTSNFKILILAVHWAQHRTLGA